MAQVVVLLVGLDPDALDLSDGPAAAIESRRAAVRGLAQSFGGRCRSGAFIADLARVAVKRAVEVGGPSHTREARLMDVLSPGGPKPRGAA